MAINLELRYQGGCATPHKLRFGGLRMRPRVCRGPVQGLRRDRHRNDWNLYVGGNGGATPRHADLLAQDLSDAELVRLIDRFLMFYIRTADRLERTSTWLEQIPAAWTTYARWSWRTRSVSARNWSR